MDALREQDDGVRAVLAGKQIGNGAPITDFSAKDLLQSAQSNFNRREYLRTAVDLKGFSDILRAAKDHFQTLTKKIDEINKEFLFGGLNEQSKDLVGQIGADIKRPTKGKQRGDTGATGATGPSQSGDKTAEYIFINGKLVKIRVEHLLF